MDGIRCLLTTHYGARGFYQSYINIVYGVASSLGAATGGFMADSLGWRWEFGIQVPPLVLCALITWAAVPDRLGVRGEDRGVWQALKNFDFLGSLLLTTSIVFFILSLVSRLVVSTQKLLVC